jgi:hypothetical protein
VNRKALYGQLRRLESPGWHLLFVLAAGGFARACWLSLTTGFVPLVLMVSAWALPSLILAVFLIVRTPTRSFFRVGAIALILATFTVLADWPFQLAVTLSRKAMNRAAIASTPPERLGLFPVLAAERRGTVLALWTDLNRSGRSGLIYSPSGQLPFNLWSQQAIGSGWFFVVED